MLTQLILISLTVSALSIELQPQIEGRIVGGADIQITEHPYQVSIQRFGAHFCGGAIFREDIVITAAHCLHRYSASSLTVRAGSNQWNTGGQLREVYNYMLHEYFDYKTLNNDIAVIRLSSRLLFSPDVKAIVLPSYPPNYGTLARVSGWGTSQHGGDTLATKLKSAQLSILDQVNCADSNNYGYGPMITRDMICAYAVGRSACEGDDGGPLVTNNELFGIYSWSFGCAYAKYPGVYTNVVNYRSWILNAAMRV